VKRNEALTLTNEVFMTDPVTLPDEPIAETQGGGTKPPKEQDEK